MVVKLWPVIVSFLRRNGWIKTIHFYKQVQVRHLPRRANQSKRSGYYARPSADGFNVPLNVFPDEGTGNCGAAGCPRGRQCRVPVGAAAFRQRVDGGVQQSLRRVQVAGALLLHRAVCEGRQVQAYQVLGSVLSTQLIISLYLY